MKPPLPSIFVSSLSERREATRPGQMKPETSMRRRDDAGHRRAMSDCGRWAFPVHNSRERLPACQCAWISSRVLPLVSGTRKNANNQAPTPTIPYSQNVAAPPKTCVSVRNVMATIKLTLQLAAVPMPVSYTHLRVILGSAEAAIAGKFVEAAAIYAGHPWALQLRAMNIIYETTKERGATILMPSSMVDSLNPSAATLALALASNALVGPAPARLPVAA